MEITPVYGGSDLPYGSREIKQVIGDLSGYPSGGWVICNEENNIAYGQDEQGKDIVPNLCGYFLRGFSESVGQEYPGSQPRYADYQADSVGPHIHEMSRNFWGTAGSASTLEASRGVNNSEPAYTEPYTTDETRPKNFAVAYIIKIS